MSGSHCSTLFKLMPRLASLPMTISLSVVTLNRSSAVSLISAFSSTISHLLALKSKRLASSFLAWFTAFSISIELTCETMSNEGIIQFTIYDLRFTICDCVRAPFPAQILNCSGGLRQPKQRSKSAATVVLHLQIEHFGNLCQLPFKPERFGQ